MSKLLFLIIEEIRIFFKAKSGVFWVIIFPMVTLLILGLVFGNVSSIKTKVGIIDQDNSAVSRFYVENIHVFKNLEIKLLKSNKYKSQLNNRKLDIVVIINPGFVIDKKPIRIIYNFYRARDIFYGLMTLRAYNQAFMDTMNIKNQSIEIEEISLGKKNRSYIEFLIPGIISMVILSMAIFSVGIKLSYMKGNGFLKRLSIVPISRSHYIIANLISYLIIITVVSLILLMEAHYVFGVSFPSRFLQWASFLILGSASFLAFAFLLPSFTSNGDKADIIGQMLFFFMMFLGDSYFPVENMPNFLKYIAYALPNTYFNDGLRRLYFKDMYQYQHIFTDSIVLILALIIFTVIAVFKFKWIDDK